MNMNQEKIDKLFSLMGRIIGKIIGAWLVLAIFVIFLMHLPLPEIGSFKEVKNANPEYEFEDIHFQNLVEENSKYTSSYGEERYDLWNLSTYQSNCEIFAPDWKKVSSCISMYKLCEFRLPLGKYNDDGNHNPEFLNNISKAIEVYFDSERNPEKYPEYQECIDTTATKWTLREYEILAIKILYIIPVLIVGLPIEYIFGAGATNFILGPLD